MAIRSIVAFHEKRRNSTSGSFQPQCTAHDPHPYRSINPILLLRNEAPAIERGSATPEKAIRAITIVHIGEALTCFPRTADLVLDIRGQSRHHWRTPVRIDVHYLITAWASTPDDEHNLLARALMALLRHPYMPTDLLPDSLSRQTTPVAMQVAQHDT